MRAKGEYQSLFHSRLIKSYMKTRIFIILGFAFITFALSGCDITTTTTTSSTTDTTSLSTSTTTTTLTTSEQSTSTTSVETTLRVFTLVELSAYNGNGGTTAYVAVNGVVYDVTNAQEWTNGWHQGLHLAGTDASTAFESSPHSITFISQLPIVGTLGN